mmetsp:Transcript_31116/g.52655  ORF Transcript_31116/g.52655 Transcript_31116/m.52655 type:complete len:173 (+) Transcript_31116:123-641(+)
MKHHHLLRTDISPPSHLTSWMILSPEQMMTFTLSFALASFLLLRSWPYIYAAGRKRRRCAPRTQGKGKIPHIVLLGDSTLDNKNWLGELPSVTEHLRLKIKNRPQHCRGWRVTNHSIDGYMINGVVRTQLPRVTKEMTHLVISVGGETTYCLFLNSFHYRRGKLISCMNLED